MFFQFLSIPFLCLFCRKNPKIPAISKKKLFTVISSSSLLSIQVVASASRHALELQTRPVARLPKHHLKHLTINTVTPRTTLRPRRRDPMQENHRNRRNEIAVAEEVVDIQVEVVAVDDAIVLEKNIARKRGIGNTPRKPKSKTLAMAVVAVAATGGGRNSSVSKIAILGKMKN